MATLAVKPQRWTRDRIDAVIDGHALAARKWDAMQAHRTQAPDLKAWGEARQREGSRILFEEAFIRERPARGGPVEDDLFAALRRASAG